MTPRRQSLLYWALFALIASSLIVRIRLHGLAFPPPWPDESSFVWPALAFSETGSLFAPEIYSRELMWMPPGYMILNGAIFELTGFSFEWARTLSGIYLCGAFACVCALGRGLGVAFASLVLALVFLHSPIAAMAANTARMETLLLLVSAAGFLLFAHDFRAASLSLVALAPLVHPNGIFPLLGLAALCLVPTRANLARLRPRRPELVAILAAATAWLGYGVHVWRNFRTFRHDWAFQLKWKQFQTLGQSAFSIADLWIVAAILVLTLLAVFKFRALEARFAVPLAVFAAALWLQTLLTVGWLYEVNAIFMDFIAALLAVRLAGAWLARRLETRPFLARAAAPALALAAAAGCARFVVASDFAMRSVTPTVRGIWPAPPAYLRADDRAAVAKYLAGLSSEGRPITVNFLPDADALAFQDLRTNSVRFSQPAFGVVLADVYIFHDSRWLPKLLRDMMLLRLAFNHLVPVPLEDWTLLHWRDDTESWRVYRRPQSLPNWPGLTPGR